MMMLDNVTNSHTHSHGDTHTGSHPSFTFTLSQFKTRLKSMSIFTVTFCPISMSISMTMMN